MMKPMCLTQRKAAVTSGRPGQRAVVRAQQPHRPAAAIAETEQRQERLQNLAEEFTNHWVKGIKQGPTQEVVRALHTVTSSDIDIQSVKPLGKSEFKSVDGLRDFLTLEHNREGTLIPTRIAIAAAAEEDDVVFALLEGEATQKRPLLGSVAGSIASSSGTFAHRAYGIAKFDMLVDDVSRAVNGVNERWQLSLHDATLLAKAVPFPVGDTPETGDRELALIKTLEKSGAELFPKDRIRAINYDREAARRNLDKWVEARTTGKNETTLLQEAFDQASLRTWDVMGVLPLVCGMKRGKEHGAAPTDTIFNYAGTLAFVRDAKARNNIVCSRIDAAVSREYNVGFLHWKSHITPQGAGKDQEHTFEGLEMHVFNEQGKITDIWMLRDPSKPEEDMMARLLGPGKAAQHVVSHKLQN